MSTAFTADLWVDPICPFAWATSRWLQAVAEVRPVTTQVHVMSLSVLNRGRDDISDFYRELVDRAWGSVRVAVAAEQHGGPAALAALYDELGVRIHHQGRRADDALHREALIAVGLPAELAAAAHDTGLDDAVAASHQVGIDLVGQDVGTPVLRVTGPDGPGAAFFGPVLVPAPTGEAAGRVWDAVVTLSAHDQFFELKRARTRDPVFTTEP
jgi:hypothetical protein